jgi:hypothetical protein
MSAWWVSNLVSFLAGGSRYRSRATSLKARVFLILVELSWLFLKHAHKVFDKMLVRGVSVIVVSLGTLACTILCFLLCFRVPTPIMRTSSFLITSWS